MAHGRDGWGRRRFLKGAAAAVGGAAIAQATKVPAAAAATAVPGEQRSDGFGTVVVTPRDQQYGELVHGVNQRYVGTPEAVYLVDSVDEVPHVLREAVSKGKRLTVRAGGHCLEDFVDNPDVEVVLDVSRLNKVTYDRARNAVCVEAGARILDVYQKLYELWGVTVPAGICYSVGMGGHVSGGGWGLLCRQYGLVIDHLYAVEVVCVNASGRVKTVIATRERDDPHRDLWWAHAGGGGGNFGVITRYWFRSPRADRQSPGGILPRPPESVYLSAVSWPWDEMSPARFEKLVRNYGAWFTAHSDPGVRELALASFLVLTHESTGQIGMVTQVDATVPGARRMLDDYLDSINKDVEVRQGALTRRMAEVAPMAEYAEPRHLAWLEATRYLGTTNANLTDPTLRQEYKSAYMRSNFPEQQVATLYRHLTRDDVRVPGGSVTLSSYGGQVNAVAPRATAYPHRESVFKMMWMSLWTDAADDDTYVRWNREFYGEMYADTGGVPVPNGVTDGCYVNYPDVDLNDRRFNRSSVPWHGLYYKGNYPRLQRVKQAYDPRDFFRHRQSIRLPR
jgi:FAD/FMN-containing dehydrogenase